MSRQLTDEFLTHVGRQYNEHVSAGQKPGPAIANAEGAPVATAHRWIQEARKRGIIPPTTQGLPSAPAHPQGNAGKAVRENVQRLRQARRMTFVELSAELSALGRPIPVLGLRRIETGTRRVDVDDLVALAETFGVSPAQLLEPLPECVTCQGAPPPGFTCATCGAGVVRPGEEPT
jgi:hypothetical protein